jgi:hypothetical protein
MDQPENTMTSRQKIEKALAMAKDIAMSKGYITQQDIEDIINELESEG